MNAILWSSAFHVHDKMKELPLELSNNNEKEYFSYYLSQKEKYCF